MHDLGGLPTGAIAQTLSPDLDVPQGVVGVLALGRSFGFRAGGILVQGLGLKPHSLGSNMVLLAKSWMFALYRSDGFACSLLPFVSCAVDLHCVLVYRCSRIDHVSTASDASLTVNEARSAVLIKSLLHLTLPGKDS